MRTTLSAVLGAALVLFAFEVGAQFSLADRKVDLVIESRTLADALNQWAQQSGINLVSLDWPIAEKLTARTLKGTFSAQEALDRLLEGTPLTYVWLNEKKAVRIHERTTKTENRQSERIRVAQLDDGLDGQRLGGAVRDTKTERDNSQDVRLSIPEVLVEGSRILNIDIARSRDDVQPYVVFDRKLIQQSNAVNVEDFLKQRLPMATNDLSSGQLPTIAGNTSNIALRGLLPRETLILIDGHRVAGYGLVGGAQQPDLNSIPLAAIERIEVLPTTASGIYGGSATGGVINVILRRDYSGLETKLTYGNTFRGDAAERRIDLSAGMNFEDGRTSLMLTGSYADSGALIVRERDLLRKGRERILANNPSAFNNAFAPPLGATANICAGLFFCDGAPLSLKDGSVPLDASITSAPIGYAGLAADAGVALLANAGSYNLGLADTAQGSGGGKQSLLNDPTIQSLSLTLRREFTPSINAYVDLAGAKNEGRFAVNSSSSTFALSAFSPSNPFEQDILVTVPATGLDGVMTSTLRTRRATGGVTFALSRDWRLGVDSSWNRTSFANSRSGGVNIVTAGIDAESGTLDLLSGGANLSGYRDDPDFNEAVDSTLADASVVVGGPLFRLPGGPVVLTARAEHRKETYDDFTQVSTFAGFTNRLLFPKRTQTTSSLYLESRIPLVSPENDVPAVSRLELQLAGRVDDYEVLSANTVDLAAPAPIVRSKNTFSSTDPLVALAYQPIKAVTLRASYGTGFLPPTFHDVVPGVPQLINGADLQMTDPRRGDEPLGLVTFHFGGSPDLKPEQSESYSLGFVLQPQSLPGLRVSVDWTRIEKTDGITSFVPIQDSLVVEPFLPALVVRDAPAPGDPFGVGPIVEFHSDNLNVAHRDIEAYDVAFDYTWQTDALGSFAISSIATKQVENALQVVEGTPVFDDVGFSTGLKWKGNLSLAWELNAWTAQWTARYFDSYEVGSATLVSTESILNQGSSTIPSQTYHDLFVGYRFDQAPGGRQGLLEGLELQLGIRNVFDKEPPIDVQRLQGSLYSTWGDPRLSSYYLSIGKRF